MLEGHTDRVDCAMFSKQGDKIVSCGGNEKSIRVWGAGKHNNGDNESQACGGCMAVSHPPLACVQFHCLWSTNKFLSFLGARSVDSLLCTDMVRSLISSTSGQPAK